MGSGRPGRCKDIVTHVISPAEKHCTALDEALSGFLREAVVDRVSKEFEVLYLLCSKLAGTTPMPAAYWQTTCVLAIACLCVCRFLLSAAPMAC